MPVVASIAELNTLFEGYDAKDEHSTGSPPGSRGRR